MIMVMAVAIAVGFAATLVLAPAGSLLMIVLVPIAASIAAMLAAFLLAYPRIGTAAPVASFVSRTEVPAAANEDGKPQPVIAA